MPPVFKTSKDRQVSQPLRAPDTPLEEPDSEADHTRQLLISLGLAEEAEVQVQQPATALQEPQLIAGASGRITSSPSQDEGDNKVASSSVYDKLRQRVEVTTQKLSKGVMDESACDEVQDLLFSQQHQIDLLLRGQSSLRGSMNSLRRMTQEKDSKTTQLHTQLEQEHRAAIKDMEAKLEKAIQQVQQLQQNAKNRQQQQAAGYEQSLQYASSAASQAQSRADELQEALLQTQGELKQAQQLRDSLEGQLAIECAALESQRAAFLQQQQELAASHQAALVAAELKAAALAAAEAESLQLSQRIQEATAMQQDMSSLCSQLQDQVQQATAAAQRHQADSASERQVLLVQVQQLQAELQQSSAAQQQGVEQCQQLEQQCVSLKEQLLQAQSLSSELQAQLAALHKQQAAAQDESAGVQQELVAAVQAKGDLEVQLQQASTSVLGLQVRLQQTEATLQAVQQQQAAAVNEQAAAAQEQQALHHQVEQLEAQLAQHTTEQQGLRADLLKANELLQAATVEAQEAKTKLTAAETDTQQLQWKVAALQTELHKLQRSSTSTIQQLREEADALRKQLSSTEELAQKQVAKAQAAAAQEVDAFRQRWSVEFDKRRKLHNEVIELKGNIRVLARIRPLIEKERAAACSDAAAVRAADEETVLLDVSTASTSGTSAAQPRQYEFDRVFGPADGQQQVYEEVGSLVTSVMDGYNAVILAYGQTGSGKTFTIDGPPDNPGINSRALADLFEVAQSRSAEFTYSLSASVVEIYNEQLFDLLAGNKDTGDKLDIKEGPSGLFIPNLRAEPVAGPEDVSRVLQKGKQNRSTFATNMNEHSSRSHLVLTVYVSARNLSKGTTWSSKLHLIDLAGSERVSRSGAEGERLKEAASINKSLSALGDVVAALQQRSQHVPYRNSKLTRLLEDSLGGSSKTLLLVHCSPAAENAAETKCSLDFASRAARVALGAAVRAVESSSSSQGVGSSPSGAAAKDSPSVDGSRRPPAGTLGSPSMGGVGSNSSSSSSPRVSGQVRQSASRRAAGPPTVQKAV